MSKELTQEQRLDFLVEEFKADSDEYKNLETPKDTDGKRRILRSLMNIRMPKDMVDCYRNTLDMCLDNGLKSVAFCCISTGVFHFPNKRAAEIAVETVQGWLRAHPGQIERVIFNVFKDEDKVIYERLLS